MNSRDYWAMRSAQDMVDRMGTAEQTAAEMNKAIQQSADYIAKEVKAVFRGIESFGISESEARKILNAAGNKTALQNLRAAAQRVSDPDKRQALMSAIDSAGAYRYRITRLEQLNKDINAECRKLYHTENRAVTSALKTVANDSYYHSIFNIQQEAGLGFSFAKFSQRDVDRILRGNWLGGNYSQRIWKDVSATAESMKKELLVSMLSGRSNEKTARIIQERFGVNAYCARRIVRTESAYVANAAQMSAYDEAGVEKYRFIATLDSKTSEVCAALDGKVFPAKDAKPGTNYPPMHPFCRSTTIAEFGEDTLAGMERRARDKDGNVVKVPADMGYEEWYRKFVEKEAPAAVPAVSAVQPEIKQSSFIPAKTIQEAEEYAARYIETRLGDKTFKGVADFKGVSLEHANDINRALSDVFDKYDIPKISGIKAIDPNSAKGKKIFTSADAVMAYSPVEHGVYINKSVLKSPEALAAYNKQAQQAWDTVMDNIDNLTGAQRETAMRYKNAGRSLVGDGSAHDYFVHEMGHHIQWEAFDAKTNNAVGSRMSQYAGGISGYAAASKSEYFAESFAAFEKGELDKLDPDFVSFLRGKSLDKSAESGIMKMGKASGNNAQMPPDFSKYNVVDDPDGILKLKSFISAELHVSEKDIDISKLRNAEVAKPFMERLKKVQTECGLKMPRIVATDLIDDDECCVAGFKPFENTFYISSRYFNSKDALLDTLRDWSKKGFMPKQCTSIAYIAEHEAAHIRMPSDIIVSEEAMKIHRKRKLLNDNDIDVDEYFADAVAIFRTNKSPDANVIKAIEYLRERGVKL